MMWFPTTLKLKPGAKKNKEFLKMWLKNRKEKYSYVGQKLNKDMIWYMSSGKIFTIFLNLNTAIKLT